MGIMSEEQKLVWLRRKFVAIMDGPEKDDTHNVIGALIVATFEFHCHFSAYKVKYCYMWESSNGWRIETTVRDDCGADREFNFSVLRHLVDFPYVDD